MCYIFVLLYIWFPHTTIYVSSCYYICVLILLYLCPHTTAFLSSGEYNGAIAQFRLLRDKEKIRYELVCVLTLLFYVCVLILLYVSSYYVSPGMNLPAKGLGVPAR
jgi:hypothetical protein